MGVVCDCVLMYRRVSEAVYWEGCGPSTVSIPAVFIHLIAQQATEISDKSARKTIQPEHVIQSLEVRG